MAENTYSVAYSTNARSKCKYSGCGETITKDTVRITKTCPSLSKPKLEYYHSECIFLSFVRARATTKKIESMSDIQGVESLKAEDKDQIKKALKQFKDGELKDKVPKITRKRKADSDNNNTQKQKKQKKTKESDSDDSEEEKEVKVKAKPKAKDSPIKRKPTKKQDSSDDDSDEDYDNKKQKKTKKQKDSDSDESDKDDKVSKMIRKPVTKRKVSISSESDSEDEPKLKIQLKDIKQKKKEESNDKKKKKEESDEEIDETSSSEKQSSPSSKALSGYVIALSGKLSMSRDEAVKMIEKNGGTYAKSITKDVTHVICKQSDLKTQKLTKAKDDGKILIDENFLKKKIKQ